jgi:hypothetical protein
MNGGWRKKPWDTALGVMLGVAAIFAAANGHPWLALVVVVAPPLVVMAAALAVALRGPRRPAKPVA